MSNQPRVAKVLAALLVSMTTGAMVLMALGNNPPSAGAFCLSRYYRLGPVEKAIRSRAAQSPGRWNCIEIYYSGAKAGNIEQLASLSGLADPEDINGYQLPLCYLQRPRRRQRPNTNDRKMAKTVVKHPRPNLVRQRSDHPHLRYS